MTGSFNGVIFFTFVFLTYGKKSELIKFDMVYSLREYFQSDVILLAKNENDDEVAKKLYKFKGNAPSAFIGAINIEKMTVESIAHSISRFQNIIIAAHGSEKLVKKLIDLNDFFSKIIGSIVFVVFINHDITERITKLYLPFHSRFLLVENGENASTFHITDVYQIGINGSKIYSHFASWTEDDKLQPPKENFYFRRMDLRRHVINTMKPTSETYGKLWDIFEEHMNFTQNRVPPVYGGIYPNGTKTGIFKMIDDRVLDATQHNYKFSDERADHFDYIFPVYIAETKVYMAVEDRLNWSLFIAPFRIGIWMALFFCMILSSITIFVTLRYHKTLDTYDSLGGSAFSVIQAICFQGTRVNHSKISVYTAYVIPYLLAIVIVNSYSGVFLSHLTVKNLATPFNTLQEVVKDGSYKILVEEESYTWYFLQTDEGETATSLRQKNLLVPESEMVPFEVKKPAFNRLCNMEKLIYVTGTSDYVIQEQCNIMSLRQVVFYDVEGIVIWKGFPYKDIMTKLLKRIQFAGLMKLRRINAIVPYENPNKFQSLSLHLVLPIFLILICLTLLSLILFICESAIERYGLGGEGLIS